MLAATLPLSYVSSYSAPELVPQLLAFSSLGNHPSVLHLCGVCLLPMYCVLSLGCVHTAYVECVPLLCVVCKLLVCYVCTDYVI